MKWAKFSSFFSILLKQTCFAGHSNFHSIIETIFNCFAKNELKRINYRKEFPESSFKKISKACFKDVKLVLIQLFLIL